MNSRAKVSLIAAVSKTGEIGKDNRLPWRMPADLKRFKALTTGKPVIMGRRTYLSIGRELKERKMIIMTRSSGFKAPRYAQAAHSLNEAIALAGPCEEIMVIGGADIFSQFLDIADRLYLTVVYGIFGGDAYFPRIDMTTWRTVDKETRKSDRENPYNYMFLTLDRVK